MIDDLFTELAVGAVDRLLSPETPREEADFGLARLSARLSPPMRREEVKSELESVAGFDPELEARLLSQYLELSVDDLQQISPRVHEWLLDRLSHAPATLNADSSATLRALYFLYPDSTVRHAVVGLLVQADGQWESAGQTLRRPPLAMIWDAIDEDAGMSSEDRVDQIRLLAELLLDYVDLLPETTERALAALHQRHREETLTAHLLEWSSRLGGESGARIRRAIERSDRHGS